jgi:glycosyltransferase involved in cell wall biosynthesis
MTNATLSILIPLYNEAECVGTLLHRVKDAPLPEGIGREIIVVDDGSTDESVAIVQEIADANPGMVRLILHERNQGKGAAIRTAIQHATGEYSIIQDADLEYDPREYPQMIRPLLEGEADAVFGSRFGFAGERRVLYFWHSVANRMLTLCCNIVSDLNLTDMETCYKAFRTSLVRSIPLRSNRFGMEPELTIKLARREARIFETPISYHGRTYEEGKKIGLKDAFQAIWIIARYAFTNDLYQSSGPEILHAFSGARRFNRWMADTIRPYVGKRILEIGSGIGNLTRILLPRSKSYVATDIDPEHLARLRARYQYRPTVQVCHGDLSCARDFEPLAASVDSVVCLNVLEHVEDDIQGLRNIHSVLVPGGRAIVLVPQGQYAFGTMDVALGHFRRYSDAELREKMERCGFRVDRILHFNRISLPAWIVSGRWLKRETISPWGLRIFDRFVWLWRIVDRFLPWGPASIIGIGIKAES